MKKNTSLKRIIYLILFLLLNKAGHGQGFQCFIANDQLSSPNVFEFDVMIKDTSQLTSPGDEFLIRTVQQAFTINPAFSPVGTPTITITGTGLANYTPGLIKFNNTTTLSAFQCSVNNATGGCPLQAPILSSGNQVVVAHWRIAYPVGTNFNCVPHNLSMVRPTDAVTPGGNVVLRFAVTKWFTTDCSIATSVTINLNGLYTSQVGGTLLAHMNNSAPAITNPVNATVYDCGSQTATFSVSATTVLSDPVTYQWLENGVPLANNAVYSGVTTSQLTITNPTTAFNQRAYSVVVTQCNTRTSSPAILTVLACPGIQLNLHVFIEGFYLQNGTMAATVSPGNYPQLCDTILAELRNPNYPYNVIYFIKSTIDIYGNGVFTFPNNALGQTYYLAIHHRNAIETWSASPIVFNSSSINYSFANAANKAYGSNLKDLADGNFAMWSGDIIDALTNIPGKQDGLVESADYGQMENAVYYTLRGYIPEDVTGDGIVESADYVLMENNVYYSVHSVRP